MTKKILPLFVLITLGACLLSYKFGSVPVAHAQSLPPSPNTWVLHNAGGNVTTPLTVTKPAGGSGVQHVATCVIATFSNQRTTSFTTVAYLFDGNYGGPQLLTWNIAAPGGPSDSVNLCGLNVVGTANTPMTAAIGDNTNIFVTVGLVGYDAQ